MENFSMAYLKKINYELCYSYNIGIVIEIGVFLKEFAVTFLYFYDSFFIFWKRYQAGHCLLFTKLPFTSLVKTRSPHLSMEIIGLDITKIYLSFWNKFILVEKIALKKKNTWYLDNSGAANFSLCLFFFFPFLSFFHSTILQQDLKVKVPSAIEGHRLIPTAYRTTRDKHRVHSPRSTSRSSFGQVCTKGGETCEEGGARAFERKLTWTK